MQLAVHTLCFDSGYQDSADRYHTDFFGIILGKRTLSNILGVNLWVGESPQLVSIKQPFRRFAGAAARPLLLRVYRCGQRDIDYY